MSLDGDLPFSSKEGGSRRYEVFVRCGSSLELFAGTYGFFPEVVSLGAIKIFEDNFKVEFVIPGVGDNPPRIYCHRPDYLIRGKR
ncbi:hypothetical protein COU61_03030 [Candidatus Pacearchaeota archaeon CG10_big_fil_rev_8_21_14_0_10_35_13]|nr:MAG: hypothetical protein COU61_03030 [Candidatus Pacearchaeota archaeon CG10_big_fil_rev_8_21_14_0_10_35_13]